MFDFKEGFIREKKASSIVTDSQLIVFIFSLGLYYY